MAFDSATFNDGVIVARRGNEQIRLYASSFAPLGDPSQDRQWQEDSEVLKAEADRFKQMEQRRIAEAHQLLADEWEREQTIEEQDEADELRHTGQFHDEEGVQP